MARKPSTRITVTGAKELNKLLETLKVGSANKVMRGGLAKGTRIILKSMKAQVPSQYKSAKKALGAINKKNRIGVHQAKVGAGVGKAASAEGKSKRRGSVGIGGRNIHWFILGTEKRTTEAGQDRGAMPAVLANVVKAGFAGAASSAMAAIVAHVKAGIEKEVARLRGK